MNNPTPMETLLGKASVPCINLTGQAVEIEVHQVHPADFQDVMDAMNDEGRLLQIYTRKPLSDLKRLRLESWERLVEEGNRINADFFGRWLARKMALLKPVLEPAPASASPTPSPNSPSKPG